MSSLIFRSLDHHVVHGAADRIAVDDGTVRMTYAELLGLSAAFAGGLAQIGVHEGTPVDLQIDGINQVIAILACARLGAMPQTEATFRIDGSPPVVHTGEHDYAWATVLSAGKGDPAPAPEVEDPEYDQRLHAVHYDLFIALIAGETHRP